MHNGQLLVSTGLNELDQLIGGGLPIGSLTCVMEDRLSQHANRQLQKYFVSEGISCGHRVIHASMQAGSMALQRELPWNVSFQREMADAEEQQQQQKKQTTATAVVGETSAVSSSSSSSGKSTSASVESEELRIAWRYRDFVQEQIAQKKKRQQEAHYSSTAIRRMATGEMSAQSSASTSRGDNGGGDGGAMSMPVMRRRRPRAQHTTGTVLCHEYDLSKPIQQELWNQEKVQGLIHVVDVVDTVMSDSDDIVGADYYQTLLREIARIVSMAQKNSGDNADEPSSRIVRISIESLGCRVFSDGSSSRETRERRLVQFVHALRSLLRRTLSVCLVTLPVSALLPQTVNKILHASDTVLEMRSFVGSRIDVSDYEFREYSGLFELKKLPRMNSLVFNFNPQSLQYAFKMKRRKMIVEKLHLPPEETRQASNPDRVKFRLDKAPGDDDDDEFGARNSPATTRHRASASHRHDPISSGGIGCGSGSGGGHTSMQDLDF